MKPFADYPGYNLEDIDPSAIAFVNEGANKKKFFLFKEKKGSSMEKNMAINLIKSGKLSNEEVDALVASVAENDQAEVKKVADDIKKSSGNEKAIEALIEKVGNKLSKDTMTKLNEISAALKGVLSKMEELAGKPKEEEVDENGVKKNKDKDLDKELSDDEVNALIKSEFDKEEGGK